MNKKEIAKRYKELVANAENLKVYDCRGEYHGYACKNCGYITATSARDKGVTPFTIICPKCGNISTHVITTKTPPPSRNDVSEVKYWVRPTLEQLLKMGAGNIDHVLRGGLVLEEDLK